MPRFLMISFRQTDAFLGYQIQPIAHPAPSNPNQVVIEHESENVAAFDDASAEWGAFLHGGEAEDTLKAWSELAEDYTTIENWTLIASYKRQVDS